MTKQTALGKKPPQTGEAAVTMRIDVAAVLRHYRQSLIEISEKLNVADGEVVSPAWLRKVAKAARISAGVE